MLRIKNTDALIVVDLQNDFVTGSLAVPDAQDVTEPINRLAEGFNRAGATVIATKDWHPPAHCSFSPNSGLWPIHCVQGSSGADLVSGLRTDVIDTIIHKGMSESADSYSGFRDDGGRRTGLSGLLRERGVTRVFVVGLALDFCVKATADDAADLGFETYIVTDLTRAVDPDHGITSRAAQIEAKDIEV
jgi:nicotinamidase/pyrazinamidase